MFISIAPNSKLDLIFKAAASLLKEEVQQHPVRVSTVELDRNIIEIVHNAIGSDVYLRKMFEHNPTLYVEQFRFNYLHQGGDVMVNDDGMGYMIMSKPDLKIRDLDVADLFTGAVAIKDEYLSEGEEIPEEQEEVVEAGEPEDVEFEESDDSELFEEDEDDSELFEDEEEEDDEDIDEEDDAEFFEEGDDDEELFEEEEEDDDLFDEDDLADLDALTEELEEVFEPEKPVKQKPQVSKRKPVVQQKRRPANKPATQQKSKVARRPNKVNRRG